MANYLIKHTDPANGSFLVQDDQIDGTNLPWDAALYVNPVSSLTALTSNSSIVIPGRGITDYGELFANDLIHMMEHFAYATRPLTPAQGQIWYKNVNFVDPTFPTDPTLAGLYVWDGSAWGPILSAVAGVVNMAGARITNLGNPIAATDAINLQSGDARYVLKGGDTMTGFLTLSADPTLALHAATRQYVDNTTVSISGDTMTGLLVLSGDPVAPLGAATMQYVDNTTVSISGDTMTGLLILSGDPVAALGAATRQYVDNTTVSVTGDTMTGTLLIDLNADLLFAGGGTGIISGGARRIQNISDPSANQDAATKFYVDQAVAGVIIPPGVDTYAVSTSFDSNTGELTITRNDAVVISTGLGAIAPFIHTHTSNVITYDLTSDYGQGLLRGTEQLTVGYPIIPVYNVLRTFDRRVGELVRSIRRSMFVGNGSTATITLPADMQYTVGRNRLQVFVDGVKQYADQFGRSTVAYVTTPLSFDTVTGLTGSYEFNIAVDGGAPTTVAIAAAGSFTFYELATAITAALAAATVNATLSVDQFYDVIAGDDTMLFHFDSNTSGTGSQVAITFGAVAFPYLFTALATAAFDSVTNGPAITTDYAYFEVGIPSDTSVSYTFNTAPALGAVVETLVSPG